MYIGTEEHKNYKIEEINIDTIENTVTLAYIIQFKKK